LSYGERSGEHRYAWRRSMRAAERRLHRARDDARDPEMWEKWVTLATLGGITCLMRGTIGDVAAVPGGTDFASAFSMSARPFRALPGFRCRGFMTRTRAGMTRAGAPTASSMYRDLQSGNNVEADQSWAICSTAHAASALRRRSSPPRTRTSRSIRRACSAPPYATGGRSSCRSTQRRRLLGEPAARDIELMFRCGSRTNVRPGGRRAAVCASANGARGDGGFEAFLNVSTAKPSGPRPADGRAVRPARARG